MKKYYAIPAIFILLIIASCKPSFDSPNYDNGTADFTSYVAFGNSLTAGYADNALYVDGQLNSYPAMLAHQFALVGGNGIFNIPFIEDSINAINGVSPSPQGPNLLRTTCKLVLGYSTDCDGITSLAPIPYAAPVNQNISFFTNISSKGPFNNVGVPGIKSFQLDNPQVANLNPTNPLFNPFYFRFASTPASSTILGDGLLSNPTFFTLWLGNNDVLGYATSGGSSLFSQPNINAVDITPLDTFTKAFTNAIDKLTATGAKGAVGNIPDVTDIPFFTTVPYNGLTLGKQTDVDALNTAYAGTGIVFVLGANAFIVKDTNSFGFRQIKSDEYICLTIPQDSIKCAGWGSQKPIPDQYWLDKGEISLIKQYTTNYNMHIAAEANAHGLALVDFNAYFKTVTKGIVFNGVDYSPVFVSGGAFSLDGVHPNKRGYALIANQYIRAINSKYGSTIPEVDVNSYQGIVFP